MKKIIFILILFTFSYSFAQTKYFIYFKDKGIKPAETFSKADPLYKEAESLLSERSIERRKKNLGDDFITYEDLPIKEEYINKIEELNVKIERKLTWFNSVSAYLTEEQKDIISTFTFVEKIEPVKTIKYRKKDFPPSDQLRSKRDKSSGENLELNYGESFGQLNLSDIPVVHTKGITGEGVLVGLLDSGFDWKNHESLQDRNIIAEYDFVFNDSVTANEPGDHPQQDNHGTSVLSVAGGFKDSTLIGAAYNASFILAKTEDIRSETHIEEDNYAAALIWMENFGVDITSSSLGYSEFDDTTFSYTYSDMNGSSTIVTKACEMAFDRGVLTITSAGNEGNNSWHFITAPADGFNTIAIGAVTNSNVVTSFSSRGPTFDGRIKPDVVTQGLGVFAATPFDFSSYSSSFGGTSAAAPIACGAAALLLSAHPHLVNIQVRKILLETSDNSSTPNNERGYGLLSAKDAAAFPNLEETESIFKLHKIFFVDNGMEPSSAIINYSTGSDFTEMPLTFDGSFRFNFNFPSLASNQKVEFYFTYQDSSGNNFREPLIKNYEFAYGELNILLNIEDVPVPSDYILSQNFPNPFNNSTKISFIAAANEKAELIIINAIGQKIKTLFNDFANEGMNTVEWNGITDNGIEASSGVYYYILKLSGKEFGKKMVLLK